MTGDVWSSFSTTAVGALLGATSGLLVALRVSRAQRSADFLQRQLSDFYSPMAGWVRRARAHITFDQRIWKEYEAGWREVCARYGNNIPESINEDSARFQKRIEYANEQHRKEILPLYRRMLDHFTNNYWLATPDTRAYYDEFLEFVEIWDMAEKEILAQELKERVRPNMERVSMFFDHLETMISGLQRKLS